MMKILLVDQDPGSSDSLARFLSDRGLAVVAAPASRVQELLSVENPSAVLLVRRSPDAESFGVCRVVHDRPAPSRTPLLLLVGQAEVADRIAAFEAGADDVVVGPVTPEEIDARLRALLRRAGAAVTPDHLVVGDLRIDRARHRVTRAGEEIPLTLTEFNLLEFFARRKNIALTRREILEAVWGGSVEGFTNIVDVYVNYLRKKIERSDRAKLLKTVRGVGYLLEEPASDSHAGASAAV